jgi:hypothetical protein
MIPMISLLLSLHALFMGLVVANDAWSLSFVGTMVVVALIVGFAVAAVGSTIRHDV